MMLELNPNGVDNIFDNVSTSGTKRSQMNFLFFKKSKSFHKIKLDLIMQDFSDIYCVTFKVLDIYNATDMENTFHDIFFLTRAFFWDNDVIAYTASFDGREDIEVWALIRGVDLGNTVVTMRGVDSIARVNPTYRSYRIKNVRLGAAFDNISERNRLPENMVAKEHFDRYILRYQRGTTGSALQICFTADRYLETMRNDPAMRIDFASVVVSILLAPSVDDPNFPIPDDEEQEVDVGTEASTIVGEDIDLDGEDDDDLRGDDDRGCRLVFAAGCPAWMNRNPEMLNALQRIEEEEDMSTTEFNRLIEQEYEERRREEEFGMQEAVAEREAWEQGYTDCMMMTWIGDYLSRKRPRED